MKKRIVLTILSVAAMMLTACQMSAAGTVTGGGGAEATGDWQTFTFEVEMKDETDDNGRVEFNMGKQGSTATVHIRNVKLIKK